MVTELFADNTAGELTASAIAGATTLVVETLTGTFPNPGVSQQFHCVVNSGATTAEIIQVTTNASGTFTLSTGLLNAHNPGELVVLIITTAGLGTLTGGGGGGGSGVTSVTGTPHQIASTGGNTPVLSFPTNGIVLPASSGGHLTTQGGTTLDDGSGNLTVGGNETVTGSITGPSFNTNTHSGTSGTYKDSTQISGGIQIGRGIAGSSKVTGMLDGPFMGVHTGSEPPPTNSAFATGDFYFGTATGGIWRWSGSAWVQIYTPTGSGVTAPFFSATDVGASRFMGSSSAAPSSGTFIAGDFLVDKVHSQIWVCTAGGTPGTWNNFGAPAATPTSIVLPHARIYANSSMNPAPGGAFAQIVGLTEDFGSGITWTGGSPNQLTIATTGIYQVNAQIDVAPTAFGPTSAGYIQLGVAVNGTIQRIGYQSFAVNQLEFLASVSDSIHLNSGDVVTIQEINTSLVTVAVVSGTQNTFLSLSWVSA